MSLTSIQQFRKLKIAGIQVHNLFISSIGAFATKLLSLLSSNSSRPEVQGIKPQELISKHTRREGAAYRGVHLPL